MGGEASGAAGKFFRALYDGVGAGYIEIRSIPPGGGDATRKFFQWPNKLDKALEYCASLDRKAHVYFGVALRRYDRAPKDLPDLKLGGKDNVGAVTCAFADLDFKDVPEDELRRRLTAFKIRPSIVVKSGGGVYPFWLFDYPVMQSQHGRLEAVNKAILLRFGGQVGTQDCTRILRVPGTTNIKDAYPDPKPVCQVSYFRPESKCKLEDLETELAAELSKLEAGKLSSLSRPAGSGPAGASPTQPQASAPTAPPPALNRELTPELTQKLAELLTGIWIDHHHHFLAMYVSGVLAHSGYSLDSALRLIRGVCTLAGDTKELHDRERACRDTYEKHLSGKPVSGAPTLEAMIDRFPGVIKERARKVWEVVKKSIPRDQKKSPESAPDFEVVPPILKFDSRPAIWSVTLKLSDGETVTASCETAPLFNYAQFQAAVFEQTHVMLKDIKLLTWKKLIASAPVEVRETPKEARPDGAIETAVEEFMLEAKQNPELATLKVYPGYDEESSFFRTEALKQFLKHRGFRFEDRTVLERIKALGWASGVKRFGGSTQRLWVLKTNGHGNGNGVTHRPGENPFPSARATPSDARGGSE